MWKSQNTYTHFEDWSLWLCILSGHLQKVQLVCWAPWILSNKFLAVGGRGVVGVDHKYRDDQKRKFLDFRPPVVGISAVYPSFSSSSFRFWRHLFRFEKSASLCGMTGSPPVTIRGPSGSRDKNVYSYKCTLIILWVGWAGIFQNSANASSIKLWPELMACIFLASDVQLTNLYTTGSRPRIIVFFFLHFTE